MNRISPQANGRDDSRIVIHKRDYSTMRDFTFVLFRHKALLCISFSTVFMLVVAATYLAPEIYRSEAKILIHVSRDNVGVLESDRSTGSRMVQNHADEVRSEVALLSNQNIAEAVVDQIGADRILVAPDEAKIMGSSTADLLRNRFREVRTWARLPFQYGKQLLVDLDLIDNLEPRETAISTIMRNAHVYAAENSDIIEVSYESSSPQLSQDILKTLLDVYLVHHIEAHASQVSPEFFESKTAEKKSQLMEIREALSRFKRLHNISLMEKQKDLALVRIDGLEAEYMEADRMARVSDAKLKSIKKSIENNPQYIEVERVTGRANPLHDRLMELRLRRVELEKRYPSGSREMIEIVKQITEMEAFLSGHSAEAFTETGKDLEDLPLPALSDAEVTTGINQTYQSLVKQMGDYTVDYNAYIAQKEVLSQNLSNVNSQLADLMRNEMSNQALEQEYAMTISEYESFRNNLQYSRVNAALDSEQLSNVRMIQAATYPIGVVRPKKIINLSLGFLLALFASIGSAFAAEYLNHSVRRASDIEKDLGIPVLASFTRRESATCR